MHKCAKTVRPLTKRKEKCPETAALAGNYVSVSTKRKELFPTLYNKNSKTKETRQQDI